MWFWTPLSLSIKLAFVSTLLLLVVTIPLAWWLSQNKGWLRNLIEVLTCVPLVLPPIVVGFYLLIFLNPKYGLGWLWYAVTGQSLLFHFSGLVIGSMIYSLPFVMQPILNIFEFFHQRYTEAGLSLGLNLWEILFYLAIPFSIGGLVRGALLGFAHTLGEFGIVLMLGGNIPGETQVASVAIYNKVEQLHFNEAKMASLYLLICGVVIIFLCQWSVKSKKLMINS